MSQAAAITDGPRPEVQVLRDLLWIDTVAGPDAVAEVEYQLSNGQLMTMAAGGRKTLSSPAATPFTHYEVLFAHDPPRFWNRYADANGLIYAQVPKLLVCHFVTRSGIEFYERRLVELESKRPHKSSCSCTCW